MTAVTRILKKAKALIKTHGWQQDNYGDASCGFCALGAIRVATSGSVNVPYDGNYGAYFDARLIFRNVVGGPIPSWNDRVGTTKEDVLEAFDKAIELSRKQGE